MNEAISILHKKGIRPSYQRVAILEYLLEKKNHPTADEIFEALAQTQDAAGLSRATVFNSLKLFKEKKVVKGLGMEGEPVRYDALTRMHGHARCMRCGKILDFDLSPATISQIRSNLPNHSADFQLVTTIICKDCQTRRT